MARKKSKRGFLKWVVTLLLLLSLAIFLALSLWLGPVVRRALERFGPEVLGAPIAVQDVSVAPHRGLVTLNGLTVGSPEGFKHPTVLEASSLQINFSLFSLLGDTIVVEDLLLEEPIITYERRKGRTSLQQLQRNAEANGQRMIEQLGSKFEKGGKRDFAIERLRIRNGKVRTRVPGLETYITLGLPDVEKRNIGGKGSDLGAAAREILGSINESAGDILSQAGHSLGDAADSLRDSFKDLGDKLLK
ncbi:MAG TPA: hypothetical protein VFY13_04440 [Luteolibacter sp.]|nr:hypothetical protein [Luteolibacter sp.]